MSRARFARLYGRSSPGNWLSGISSRPADRNFKSSFVQIVAFCSNGLCTSRSSRVAFAKSFHRAGTQRSSSTENSRAEMIVQGVSWPSSS